MLPGLHGSGFLPNMISSAARLAKTRDSRSELLARRFLPCTPLQLVSLEGVVTVDLTLNIEFGKNILEVSKKVQDKVKSSIENMTGLEVADVNIRIAGVDMENDK